MSGANASGPPAMGFAGLSSLATHLPLEPVFDTPPKKPAPDELAGARSTSEARTVANPSFWTAGRRWAAVAAGLIAVIGLANWPRDTTPYRASSSSTTYSASPAYVPTQPSYAPPAVPQDPYAESKPAIGTGQTLSRNEIRYCLSERIRVEAISDYVDTTKQSQIERYNAVVADYNGRCSNFRYRQTDMNSAKATVDTSGDRLKAQAAATVRQWR